MWKHGSGYEFTYEFQRRAALDVLSPFAARVARQLELSKVQAATAILINGDGVQPAATVKASSGYAKTPWGYTANGTLNYRVLLAWLVDRAKRGIPADVVVGNYDAYVDWLLFFTPTLNGQRSEAQAMAEAGKGPGLLDPALPIITAPVKFVLSSTVPEGQLVGITRAETLEELVEAGSSIAESERAIRNQTVTYVRSEVTGYKLPFADTRDVLNFNA